MQDEKDIFDNFEKEMHVSSQQNVSVNLEKKLQIERAYVDQLFESALEGIVLADKQGHVLRINSEF
ncbi:MAG: hypothetical protein V3S65_11165, partial [Candidatus Aminicenantaceae bacterium]